MVCESTSPLSFHIFRPHFENINEIPHLEGGVTAATPFSIAVQWLSVKHFIRIYKWIENNIQILFEVQQQT